MEFYRSLTARAEALFELTDAALARRPGALAGGSDAVAEPAAGTMYDAPGHGRVEPQRIP